MNGKLICKVLIAMCFVGLTSCQTLVTKHNIRLSKGSTLDAFKKEDVDIDFKIALPKLSAKNKAKYEVYITTIHGANTKELYYYAFQDDKLVYWGYPYQFTRNENALIQEIGEEALETPRQN